MLAVDVLGRIFTYTDNGRDIELADPDDTLSPEAVLNFYSNAYPALTTAKVEGPEIEDDALRYRFVTTIGTKG